MVTNNAQLEPTLQLCPRGPPAYVLLAGSRHVRCASNRTAVDDETAAVGYWEDVGGLGGVEALMVRVVRTRRCLLICLVGG